MPRSTQSESVPKLMQAKFDEICALTDAVCAELLDGEYEQLARYATAALCRKRPSPLVTGPAKSWACGIIHALGTVNFLFDKSQTPHRTAADLTTAFGIAPSTGGNKSRLVRELLKMTHSNPEWIRPSSMESNQLIWMVSVNGFITDIRREPVEVQILAFEKGLIPYVPAYKHGG